MQNVIVLKINDLRIVHFLRNDTETMFMLAKHCPAVSDSVKASLTGVPHYIFYPCEAESSQCSTQSTCSLGGQGGGVRDACSAPGPG